MRSPQEVAVYWDPDRLHEDEWDELDLIRHVPNKETVNGDRHRTDLHSVMAKVEAGLGWYCYGLARHGEARAIASCVARGLYGNMNAAYRPAPNLNRNPRKSPHDDWCLMYAERCM